MREADAMRRWRAVLNRIPDAYRWATFTASEFKIRLAGGIPALIELTDILLRTKGPLVTLTGPSGVGKSSVAAAYLRHVVDSAIHSGSNADLVFAAGLQWFDSYTLEQGRDNHPWHAGEAPEWRAALGASVLVLDDVGREHKPHVVSEILHRRHSKGRKTLLTTYMSPQAIGERYDAGILRRIKDGEIIQIGGPVCSR
jgi:DNA replication protein DnaC